jgi:low affinity Fe/Cu permease
MAEFLRRIVGIADDFTGRPAATLVAFVLVALWVILGPRMHYSADWQLLMTTTSAVVTFLMVFVIASAQKRNTAALHLKIDMLVAAHPELTNRAIGLEHGADEHFDEVREELERKVLETETIEADAKVAEAVGR